MAQMIDKLEDAVARGRDFRRNPRTREERDAVVAAFLAGQDPHPAVTWMRHLVDDEVSVIVDCALTRADRLYDRLAGLMDHGMDADDPLVLWAWEQAMQVREDLEGVCVLLRYREDGVGEELERTLREIDRFVADHLDPPPVENLLDIGAWWGALVEEG